MAPISVAIHAQTRTPPYPTLAITAERKDLVSRSDFALYDAKESGRNTFRLFDDLKKAA